MSLTDHTLRWYAVHTRSKSEKFVRQLLEKKGIHAWVPLQKIMRRYQRSRRTVEKPLINCYVFVKIAPTDFVTVLETTHVAGFVKFNKIPLPIPDLEIDLLRRITLEFELEVEAVPSFLCEGDFVEINAGNLVGVKGKIVKKEDKRKMLVELTQLGYGLLITIDRVFLEKTKAPQGAFEDVIE